MQVHSLRLTGRPVSAPNHTELKHTFAQNIDFIKDNFDKNSSIIGTFQRLLLT